MASKRNSMSAPGSSRKNIVNKGPTKMTPSQLVQRQLSGNILDDFYQKPQIKKFLNLADYSNYKDTNVSIDEPLFEPIPPLIQFTDYEPLQLKEKVFRLRNKDKVVRRVKILQPDSRLFQVQPAPSNLTSDKSKDDVGKNYLGNKIAPGMEACFTIKFSPEAKIDYQYELVVVTEREQFIVPIYAIGKRAMIDFPDILDFGQCPVKYATEKPIIIRNLGEKTTKWFLTLPQDFEADKKEGVLEFGKNEQIVIKFYPKEAKPYKSEAVLMYDKLQAYIPILGSAQNHVVYLSKSFVQMDEAYIGLQTQQTLQIINKSAVKVDFEWRAFSTEKEEQEKKNRLKQQLEEEEAEERMLLKEIVNNEAINEDFEIENGDDSDEEDRDEKAILQKRQKKAELMLARKYKDIRKAIEDDLLLFQDDIFQIEPIQGQIWPNSEMTITLTFQPKGAHSYTCPAFCNISCNQDRLALTLQGDGIGPKAFLNQNEINLGDPFVNEEVRPTIVIENQGEIECEFQLQPNERHFGKMFKFYPERGVLKVGERKEIKVEFSSSKPGEFKETFRWQLQGSSDFLSVLFIGHIRAPQFEFDTEIIDFGKVSFNFPQEEKLKLTNKSTVPFDYNLRIPGDGKMKDKEFAIDKANGTIQANETIEITIEFTPRYTKKYEMVLTIDIEGVAQDMKCLTIKAESEVPQVEIKPHDHLDFNEIFLRHRDIQGIQLINNSKLRAKFEVQEQKKESMVLAKYEVEPSTGIIEPGNTTTIQVKLFTNKLGDITLPLGIVIVGSNSNLPHIINIIASSIGPIVDVGGNLKELDFGQVDVLQNYPQKITITNKSKIEADFRAFTKNKVSIFKPIQKHGLLKPQESMEVEVVCCADDASKFQDVLHFVIKEGLDIDIVLKAKGVGSTIFCKEDLNYIDFQTLYTHKPKTREIFVENKGRKPQKLTWVRKQEKKKQTPVVEEKQNKNANKDPNNNQVVPVEEPDIFTVVPDNVVLPPKHGIMFQFRAFSTKTGKQPEQFILNSQIGNDRKVFPLYTTTVDGEFIKPTLKFSERKLSFKYTWEKNVPFAPISKNLDISSTSVLPTNFMLKYSPPFSISQENFQLLYGESATVKVDFDPGQKLDRVSGEQLGKLQIVHTDHPHRETIDLVGEVCFPNIKLEQTTVNFGAILNETSKKMIISMSNISEMGLNYEWTFLEEELVAQPNAELNRSGSLASRDSRRSGANGLPYSIPINEVFDILPLSGYLEAGEVEQVEFVYNAFGGQKFKTTAVCHVDGGPNYEVVLVGDSSLISHKISTQLIDLGELRFCDWIARDFYIENTGKVTFEYKVLLDTIKRKGYVDCQPQSGRILGGEKQKLTLKVCPVMPNDFKEILQVQVGYFEPDSITVIGKGFYPAVLVALDRNDTPEYKQKFEEEFEKKKNEREAQLKRAQLIAKAADKTPAKGQQNSFSQIKSIEQIQNDLWKEMDRQLFCSLINEQLEERERQQALASHEDDTAVPSPVPNAQLLKATTGTFQMGSTSSSKMYIGVENKLYEKIVLTSFVCDFGNVVINSVKLKSIKIVNVGPSQLEINFDTRAARLAGFTMPERPPKVLPNSELIVKISYTAKNKIKYGKNKCIVPIEIKNGAKYNLELLSNITIPEITLENAVDDWVDFGKVLCGQRKTYFVRFVNEKEIPCQWALNTRADLIQDKKKEDNKFTITPTNGIIQSGSKQLIQLTFSPVQEKQYQHKFSINIQENHKPFSIQLKGIGSQVNLEFNPLLLNIGPVLPYDKFSHAVLEITNPTPYSTELFSLEFDKNYLTEEEILIAYDDFETQDHLFVPVREPGNPIWDSVKKSVEKKKQREGIQSKLQKHSQALAAQQDYEQKLQLAAQEAKELSKPIPDPVEKPAILSEGVFLTPDEKNDLEKQLEALLIVELPPVYPDKVDEENLHHVIVLGHPGSGKTAAVKHLAAQHQRFIATVDEAVEWAISNLSEGGKKAKAFFDDKNVELENINAEREKLKKKAGKKAPELDAKWGPINENQFKFLPEDILVECLADRMKHPLCNAGLIFDGIETKYASTYLMAMKAIMRAVGKQGLQVVLFSPQLDEEGLEVWKLIEWETMEDALRQEEEAIQKQKAAAAAAAVENQTKKKKGTSPPGKAVERKKSASKGPKGSSVPPRKESAKKDNNTTISSKNAKNTGQSEKSQPTKKSGENRRESKQQRDQANDESALVDEPALFEIFSPSDYEDGIKKQATLKKLQDIKALMQNEYTDKIENPPIFDPVFDEGKKEEKKPVKKDAKGKIIVEEEPEPVLPDPIDYSDILMKGPRILSIFPLHYNMPQLYKSILEVVPAPVYPDPNSLPVPEPLFHQILTKPQRNVAKKRVEIQNNQVIKNFEILTPINNPFKPDELNILPQEENPAISIVEGAEGTVEQVDPETAPEDASFKKTPGTIKRAQKPATQSVSISKGKPIKDQSSLQRSGADETELAEPTEPVRPKYEFKLEDLNNSQSRWIIPGNKTLLLVVRFFTKKAGNFDGKFEFENFFSTKRYQVDLKGIADFPIISTLTKNLYWQFKKTRPALPPESYLSKVFVISENTFEFGPLLIGKNPDRRTDADIRKVNSSTFRISNNGKYDAHLEFSLLSSIKENDPEFKKGIFWIEPETMKISPQDVAQELRIWAIPNARILFHLIK